MPKTAFLPGGDEGVCKALIEAPRARLYPAVSFVGEVGETGEEGVGARTSSFSGMGAGMETFVGGWGLEIQEGLFLSFVVVV